MKNKEQQIRLNEQSIREAARAAVADLQLEAEVTSVEADGERWCVRFMADYGQFSDTFKDQFGKENSFELVREKIKRHILKQQQSKIRSNVRIRRGKTEKRAETDTLLDAAVKTIGGLAEQTVAATGALTGEALGRAARLPGQALTALSDAVEAINPVSQSELSPGQSIEQPLARVTVRAAGTGKSTRRSSRPARKATSKKAAQKKARPAKKAKTSTKAKASTRKAKAKPAPKSKRATAAKSGSKAGKKPGRSSKKAGQTKRRAQSK